MMNLTNLVKLNKTQIAEYENDHKFNDGYSFNIDALELDNSESYYVFANEGQARKSNMEALVGLVTNMIEDGNKVFGDIYLSRNFYYSEIKGKVVETHVNMVLDSADIDHDNKTVEYGEPSLFYLSSTKPYKSSKDLRYQDLVKTRLGFDDIYYT